MHHAMPGPIWAGLIAIACGLAGSTGAQTAPQTPSELTVPPVDVLITRAIGGGR